MPTKDYRVRLSAEGQQEVVNAFRRVQQEAGKSKQSAVDASAGFNQLKDAAHSLAAEFLGYETAFRAFEGIKGAVEGSLDFAASMGKLQEKTGLSAVSLQVWAAAAKRVDVSQETVSKGLGLFAKAMGNLQQGSAKATTSLQILLGSAKALNGLTTDEKLHKIVDGLAKMSAGSQRAKITTDLFGKAGLELLPVIDQLGGQGFDKLKDKLQSFGDLLSDNAIKEAKEAEETLGDLKLAGQGLAMQFTEGLLPSITSLAGALVSFSTGARDGGNSIKELGTKIGETTKNEVFGFVYAMTKAREVMDVMFADARAAGKVLGSWHPFRDFKRIRAEEKEDVAQAIADFKQERKALFDAMNAGDEAAKSEKTAGAIKAAEHDVEVRSAAQISAAERLARAKTGLEMEQARAILEVDKETNRAAAEFEKERWNLGIESVTQYYATRRALAKTLADEEKAALDKQIAAQQAALKNESDPAKRLEIQKTIVELQAKADAQRIQREGAIETMVLEEAAERVKLAQGVLAFEDKLAEKQGKGHAAEIAAIDREAEKYRKALTELGGNTSDIDSKVDEFKRVMKAEADFKQAEKEAEDSLRHLEDARKRINDQAEKGAISQAEKRRELIKLDKDELPALQALYAEMQKIATQSGLPELVKDTEQFGVKVDDADAALRKVKTSSKDVGAALEKSLGKDLNKFLTKGIFEAKNFGDAMKGLAMDVASSMAQMFQQLMMKMIQAKLQAKLTSAGGDDGGGGFMGFLSGLAGSEKAAGGEIHGPGTGTSDSVPIWASTGEYVVRAAAVKQPGIRELLQTINSGLVTPRLARSRNPGFAQGGIVEGGFVTGGRESSPQAQMTVGLDYGLVLKHISAHPDFGRVLVKHLDLNRKAAGAALGVRG
jgi:hypothetical protein